MRPSTMTSAALFGALVLALAGCSGGGEEPKPDKDRSNKDQTRVEPPQKVEPPPADLLESWKNINAHEGRLRYNGQTGELVFENRTIERPTDLLAFRVDEATEADLRKVAVPDAPFALILDEAHDGIVTGLKRFKSLQNLQLLRCYKEIIEEEPKPKRIQQLTATGVKAVCDVTSLKTLTIHESRITDAALAPLANLKLEALYLNNCPNLGNGACKAAAAVRPLEKLGLAGTAVTNGGLSDLREMLKLKELDLSGTGITSLTDLAGLTRLQVLQLKSCKGIDDASLAHLKDLKQLARLDLGYTAVTDAGLKQLTGLKQLRVLHKGGLEGVTAAGIADLRRSLPELRVGD